MFDDCYFDEHKLDRRRTRTLLHDRNLRNDFICGLYDPEHFMHQNYDTIVQKNLLLQVCKVDFEEIDDTFVSKKPENVIPIKKCENKNFDISIDKDLDLLWISLDTVATVEETWEDGVWAVVKTNCLEITEKKISKTPANTNRFVTVNHKFLLSLILGSQIPYLKFSCRASNVIYKGITFEYGDIITINIRRKFDKEPSVACKEKPKGKKRSWKLNGKLHRLDGPAVEWVDGSKEWWIDGKPLTEADFNEKIKELESKDKLTCERDIYGNKEWRNNDGLLHRLDGPAVEHANGKHWWVNGLRHCTDGPAVEWVNGGKCWYLNGRLHRLDGPAVEKSNGAKYWYIDGKQLTEIEFNKEIEKLKLQPTSEIDLFVPELNTDIIIEPLFNTYVNVLKGKQVKITVDSSLYHVSQTCYSFTFRSKGDKFIKIYTLERIHNYCLAPEWFYLNPKTKKKHKIGVCFSAINKDGYMVIEDPANISEILAFDVRGFIIKSKNFINIEIVKGLSAAISYTQEKDNGFETLIHTNNVNRFILKKNKKNWKLTS